MNLYEVMKRPQIKYTMEKPEVCPAFETKASHEVSKHYADISEENIQKNSLGGQRRVIFSSPTDNNYVANEGSSSSILKEKNVQSPIDAKLKQVKKSVSEIGSAGSVGTEATSVETDKIENISFDPNDNKQEENKKKCHRSETQAMISTTSQVSMKRSRNVSFGEVHVRCYELILTDHPDTRGGPSIGIGWNYLPAGTFKLKHWETRKDRTRTADEMVYTKKQRESLVRDLGYLQKEIATMVRSTYKTRCQRKRTIMNLENSDFEECVEKIIRKLCSIVRLGRKRTLKWDETKTVQNQSNLRSILKSGDGNSTTDTSVALQ